ncbi:MAG: zinc ribbon domain-containing protein [Thermoplasmata archaeon]
MSPEEKICPVCDTKLSKDATKCPICGTDLGAIDEKALENIDISVLKDKTKAIDDILSLLEEEEKKVKEKIEKEEEKKQEEKKEEPKPPEPKPTEVKVEEKVEVRKEEGTKPEEKKEEVSEVFSCPVCNEQIPIEANSCPKCGAIFEEAVVFICPVCRTEVPMDSTTCPKCGAIFVSEEAPEPGAEEVHVEEVQPKVEEVQEKSIQAEAKPEEGLKKEVEAEKVEKKVEKKPEEMAKELAQKVGEAKVLLETMRKFGVEEKETKEHISSALAAGKEKNYEKALEIMDGALSKGKKLVLEKIALLASQLESEVKGYSKFGIDVRKGIGLCQRVVFAAETENFERALKIYTMATDFIKLLKETFEARKKKIEELQRTIEEYGAYGIPGTNELRLLVERAMEFYAKGETGEGDKCLTEVTQKLAETLPNFVSSKIAEQAAKLREEKLLGLDVKDKIEYLKEANMCIKKKDYVQALMWVNKVERKEV